MSERYTVELLVRDNESGEEVLKMANKFPYDGFGWNFRPFDECVRNLFGSMASAAAAHVGKLSKNG